MWSANRDTTAGQLSEAARDLIGQLLVVDGAARLGARPGEGAAGVRGHAFFDGVDWARLEAKDGSVTPPFPPVC